MEGPLLFFKWRPFSDLWNELDCSFIGGLGEAPETTKDGYQAQKPWLCTWKSPWPETDSDLIFSPQCLGIRDNIYNAKPCWNMLREAIKLHLKMGFWGVFLYLQIIHIKVSLNICLLIFFRKHWENVLADAWQVYWRGVVGNWPTNHPQRLKQSLQGHFNPVLHCTLKFEVSGFHLPTERYLQEHF